MNQMSLSSPRMGKNEEQRQCTGGVRQWLQQKATAQQKGSPVTRKLLPPPPQVSVPSTSINYHFGFY